MDNATRTYVPVHIKYSVNVNLDAYSKITDKFEKLFKALGAKLVTSSEVYDTGDHRYYISESHTTTTVPVIKLINKKVIANLWKFPSSYKVIYPFTFTPYISGSNWSSLLRDDDEEIFLYNSTYKDGDPNDRESYYQFSDKLAVEVFIVDSQDNRLWTSEELKVPIKYDQILNYWNASFGTSNGGDRMINALNFENISTDLDENKPSTLYEKDINIQMKVEDIKNLKNVKIEWVEH